MPVPTIAALPAPPSRIGDPDNFVTESLAFLDAQSRFANECTSVATYLNAAKFDPFNWGDLGPVTGTSPVGITNPIAPAPTNPPFFGESLTDGIDDLLASFNPFIAEANIVVAWIDSQASPSFPETIDPDRPVIPIVNPSPLRNDGQDQFESKSLPFYGSAHIFSTSLQNMADYVAVFSSGSEDWDKIDIIHTETDDWGSIL